VAVLARILNFFREGQATGTLSGSSSGHHRGLPFAAQSRREKNLFLLKFPLAAPLHSPYHPTPGCTVERHAAFYGS
jgi:hypothetical protein